MKVKVNKMAEIKNPDKEYLGMTVKEHVKEISTLMFHRMYGLAHDAPFEYKSELTIWMKNFFPEETIIPEVLDYYSDYYCLK